MKTPTIVLVLALAATSASAQIDAVSTSPPNIVLPNYNGVPVGPYGGLEGVAYAARVTDPSAAWFNPAGLPVADSAQISGSAGVYQFTTIAPQALSSNNGGSLQQLPNFVGVTFKARPKLTVAVAALTTAAWNQETDSEVFLPADSPRERFAFSTDSDYSVRVLSLSAGFAGPGAWRVGGGLAFSLTSIRLVQSVGDRIADNSGLQSLLVTARATGSAVQFRSLGGVQYDHGPLRTGVVVRTPGLTMIKSGGITFDGVLAAGGASLGSSLFDSDAQFETHLPWEIQGGVAYVRARAQVEVDVQGFSSISPYSLISTGAPVRIYGSAGPGVPAVLTTRPFQGLTSAFDGVVNGSVGGHLALTSSGRLRLHGGVGSDRSPVADSDTVFNHANLYSWTLGLSGDVGKLQFGVGYNRRGGRAEDVRVQNLIERQAVHTPVEIHTGGLIYSIAYQF
ncbi:MAG TPA: hypothetical protein VKE96_25805 [Vicinamibacterales bacterium]|nr:hypothetical protein [Vicinamibacterales bacterium]